MLKQKRKNNNIKTNQLWCFLTKISNQSSVVGRGGWMEIYKYAFTIMYSVRMNEQQSYSANEWFLPIFQCVYLQYVPKTENESTSKIDLTLASKPFHF